MRRRRCDVARRSETGKEDPDVQRKRKSQRLEEESSLSSSSSSESVRSASTREADLVEKSRKHPGCLLKSALKERDEPVSFSSARGGDQKPGRREGGILPSPSGLPAVSKGRPEITARTSDFGISTGRGPGRGSRKSIRSSSAAAQSRGKLIGGRWELVKSPAHGIDSGTSEPIHQGRAG